MEDATPRTRATLLVVDEQVSTLLIRGGDPDRPDDGEWWFPPGGGVEPGETVVAAAHRELREETGLVVDDLGVVVHERRSRFSFRGTLYDAREHLFLVRVERFEPDVSGWTDDEREVLTAHRWWSPDELRSTTETIHPDDLADLVESLVGPR